MLVKLFAVVTLFSAVLGKNGIEQLDFIARQEAAFLYPTKVVEKIANPTVGSGPLPKSIHEAHPRLAFVGEINGKHYYIERTQLNFFRANDNCKSLGMHLARFDTRSEVDFVYGSLPSSDGLVWTGAQMAHHYYQDFQWTSNGRNILPETLWASDEGYVALVLKVEAGSESSNHFIVRLPHPHQFYSVCFL